MNFLVDFFNLVLYQPLFNALILLYQYFPGRDFGVAVIILTILIKLLLYPLGLQAIRTQKKLTDLQPKVEEIRRKYKNDKEKLVKETLEIYRKQQINPFSGFLPLLIQLPILIALFQVFWKGFGQEQMVYLYSFIPYPGHINPVFLGILNLSAPSIVLAFLAGITQFIQTKMMTSATHQLGHKGHKERINKLSEIMQKQMLYFLPLFTVFVLWKMPSAIGLYWTVTSLFTIGQQHLFIKSQAKL